MLPLTCLFVIQLRNKAHTHSWAVTSIYSMCHHIATHIPTYLVSYEIYTGIYRNLTKAKYQDTSSKQTEKFAMELFN